VLNVLARARPRRALATALDRELTLPFLPALGGLLALVVVGFGVSYRSLLPLANGESPDALVVALPLVAVALLALTLAESTRHGNEVGINSVFALPLVLCFVILLLWLPSRYGSVYWNLRLDLLALPILVALGVLLLFGVPALLRSAGTFGLLALGWKPVFDKLVALTADPLARLDAVLVGALASPFAAHAHRIGQLFVVGPDGNRSIGVSSACVGLSAIFSMALVGAFVGRALQGSRRAKLLWLAAGVGLAFLANLVRMTVIVVIADRVGMGSAMSVFHATAGVALFAVVLLVMLLLLRRFHLRLAFPPLRKARPLRFKARGLAIVATLLVGLAALGAWTESGFGFYGPGSFVDTPALTANDLLPGGPGVRRYEQVHLPFIELLFGRDARSYQYDYAVANTTGIGAQVVIVPTLSQASSYGALDCFLFHRYHLYATHRVALKNGGTALVAAMRFSGDGDVSAISWLQPVQVDGKHAWRRTILLQYLDGRPVPDDFRPSLSRRVGNWLLNTLAPYGSTHPPARFVPTERELLAYANAFSVRSSA
jgi:exosortase/archaeosortase family protein